MEAAQDPWKGSRMHWLLDHPTIVYGIEIAAALTSIFFLWRAFKAFNQAQKEFISAVRIKRFLHGDEMETEIPYIHKSMEYLIGAMLFLLLATTFEFQAHPFRLLFVLVGLLLSIFGWFFSKHQNGRAIK